MNQHNNIWRCFSSPLGMVGVGFLLLAFLSACSSTHFTVDDAYHWDDNRSAAATAETPSGSESSTSSSSSSSSSSLTSPTIEYTNIQDTTITVRIKR